MADERRVTKEKARQAAYEGLLAAKAARFPFPIHGRIPNFTGAEAAARRRPIAWARHHRVQGRSQRPRPETGRAHAITGPDPGR